MDYRQFETWLENLSESDRQYLDKKPGWKKEHETARLSRSLPKGFVEKTMEILEGGSESET